MKVLQLLSLSTIFVICFACHNNKASKEENKELTYIYIDSCTTIKTRPKLRFLKLETTRDCLIAGIKKMEFDDNKIFIKDSNEKIFVFDEQGKYLNTIGRIGPGPDEQYTIFDFFIDRKNKRIGVIDIFKSVIFSYSYTGDLLEKEKVNKNIFNNFSYSHLVGDHTLLLVKENSMESKYNFNLITGKNYDNVDNFVPYLFIGERWPQGASSHTVTKSGETIFMSALISDTIYRYDLNTKRIVPDMVVKGKCRPMTKEDVEEKTLEIALDALRTAKEKKLSYGLFEIVMTQKYLTFIVQDYNSLNRIIWNMETKKGFQSQPIAEYMNKNFMFYSMLGYLVTATDDAFVCVIPAEEFIAENWVESESAREVAKNTLEDDNPVIVFYYFVE